MATMVVMATAMDTETRILRIRAGCVGTASEAKSSKARRMASLRLAAIPLALLGFAAPPTALAQSLGNADQPASPGSSDGRLQGEGQTSLPAAIEPARRAGISRAGAEPVVAPTRVWKIEPRVTARETWTDNIALEARGFEHSDWVSEVSPGIAISANSARLRGSLDYTLTGLFYARDSKRNDTQNALNAFGTIEAIEKFFFVEARAQISQQVVSAFGAQPASNVSDTQNRAETRVFSLAPYIKGRLESWASYELRVDESRTRAKGDQLSDGDLRTWTGKLESATSLAQFSWLLDFKDERYDVKDGLDTETRFARATVFYRFDPQLRLFVRGGRESNNFFLEDRSETIHGFGFDWNPSERTHVGVESDKRFFGRGYRYSFQHRTPLSAWNVVLSKESTNTIDRLRQGSESTPFQRLFQLLATEIPDPVQRTQQVRQQLLAAGIPADAAAQAGFLSNQVFLDKRIEASVALIGARNTVTLGAFRSERKPVNQLAQSGDDFARASVVKELGSSMNWSRKLTPISSLVAGLTWSRNTGATESTDAETDQRALSVEFNTLFGSRTTGSLGFRHVRFDSTGTSTNDYRENAVYATVGHRF